MNTRLDTLNANAEQLAEAAQSEGRALVAPRVPACATAALDALAALSARDVVDVDVDERTHAYVDAHDRAPRRGFPTRCQQTSTTRRMLTA